jgi:hypothetical protein
MRSDRDRYCGHGIRPELSASSPLTLTALCAHHFRHTAVPAGLRLLAIEDTAGVNSVPGLAVEAALAAGIKAQAAEVRRQAGALGVL